MNRRPLVRTLRTRLTVLHLAALALTVSLFAVLAYLVLSKALYAHHDEELGRQATDLITALGDASLTDASIRQAAVTASVASRFMIVRDSHGNLIYRDPVLESTEPTLGENQMLVHAATVGAQAPTFFDVNLERSGEVRFICAPLAGGHAYVQLGEPVGEVREMLRTVALSWLPLIPLVLLLATASGWLIARRSLAPMRDVSTTLGRIQATDLARRVDVRAPDEEIAGLVTTINHLLDRLQRAFESLRQFAGDVSHQLQTPLTVMKGTVDAALRRPERTAADRDLLLGLAEEVNDMSAVVVDLRAFALADAQVQATAEVVLSDIVTEAVDIIAALGELRSVAVESEVQPSVTVRGDAVRLKQVVLNLGDNAVKYTPAGGRVTIALRASADEAVLTVADTGVGIPEQHLPRLFDRLFRADAADRSPAGSGLGLAIAKRIVDVHRGTIEVKSRGGHGSVFVVRLPLHE